MKSLPRLILSIVGCLVMIGTPLAAATADVGTDDEWKPPQDAIGRIHKECADKGAGDFGKCFVNFMERNGASAQAAAFARSTRNTGYLAHFLKMGRVDLAYVHYPFRANENEGWLIVNGDPAMIDIDALSQLPASALEKNPTYGGIKEKFPKVMLFGGDRTQKSPPEMIGLPDKGQRFVVEYRLLDGCHACERVGTARFAFDFDANGTFLGPTVLDVH